MSLAAHSGNRQPPGDVPRRAALHAMQFRHILLRSSWRWHVDLRVARPALKPKSCRRFGLTGTAGLQAWATGALTSSRQGHLHHGARRLVIASPPEISPRRKGAPHDEVLSRLDHRDGRCSSACQAGIGTIRRSGDALRRRAAHHRRERRRRSRDSAFIVENNRFLRIGRKGEVALPRGAARVDLTGKTVMPALIELHAHLGYFKTNTERRPQTANFTREQLLNDLQQLAYYGVGAVLSLGADRREIAYQVRDEWRKTPPPNAARFFTAGQGLAAPNAGPAGELRKPCTASRPKPRPGRTSRSWRHTRSMAGSRSGTTRGAARCRPPSSAPSSTRRTRTSCASPRTSTSSKTSRSCCGWASTGWPIRRGGRNRSSRSTTS